MRADIAERPGAGPTLIEPPAHGDVGVAVVVEQELGACRAHLTDGALIDQLAGHRHTGPLPVDESDLGDEPARCGGLAQPMGVVGVERQRLLAQDVLAVCQCVEGDVDVGVVRGADVDDVDVVRRRDLLPLANGSRPSPVAHRAGRRVQDRNR